jgi:DNA mismatch endonuclease, patch repair protein
MVDILSPKNRRELMSRIKVKNTKPEVTVRSAIHRLGYRFRLHKRNLPGKPDIVLSKHRKIIFVHGCFWHQHTNCSASKRPSTNVEFWNEKLNSNIARDKKNRANLIDLGWQVCIIWECETEKKEKLMKKLTEFLENKLLNNS